MPTWCWYLAILLEVSSRARRRDLFLGEFAGGGDILRRSSALICTNVSAARWQPRAPSRSELVEVIG